MTSDRGLPASLVPVETAAAILSDRRTKFVDAAFALPHERPTAHERYRETHIPGAQFFDLEEICDASSPLPHMLPSDAQFGQAVRALGISNDDLVIVYDDVGLRSSGRVWWMFRIFGHRRVAILDGGLLAWRSANFPVEAGRSTSPALGDFNARLESRCVRNMADLRANLITRREAVIDARSSGRFTGELADPWPGRRSGHIPGSLSLPFDRLTDRGTGLLRPIDEIRHLFIEAGLDLEAPAIATCGSGVTACALVFALHLVGNDNVAVYDGSWAEWGLASDTPIEAGSAGARP
jgi:thiosulfate/3-mercaptopyruvate sulfurtransferase